MSVNKTLLKESDSRSGGMHPMWRKVRVGNVKSAPKKTIVKIGHKNIKSEADKFRNFGFRFFFDFEFVYQDREGRNPKIHLNPKC